MGTYVYALRSPKLVRKIKIATPTGDEETVEAASMSYAYKPNLFYNSRERGSEYNRRLAPSERMWQHIAQESMPKYVAITDDRKGHKIQVNDTVYFFEKGAPISCDDSRGMGNGVHAGRVLEIL